MIHLGISQDRYDSGVTITDGSRVLYAANEERFTRKKCQGGFPGRALESCLRFTGVAARDVQCVSVAGLMTPPLPLRAFPRLHHWLFANDRNGKSPALDWLIDFAQFRTPLGHTGGRSALRSGCSKLVVPLVRRTLPRDMRGARLAFVEHHEAHAWSAWQLSGYDDALCVTADGMGDGLSMTVSRCRDNCIERLWSAGSRDSFGLFFETLTQAMGFIPCRHEGKLTGLAAQGDPSAVAMPSPFSLDDGQLRYTGRHGLRAVAWAKMNLIARYRREDVAAWAQQILGSIVSEIVRTWLARSGLTKLIVAGGVFANVKLNQRLHELEGVERFFVCPNMGDGGLSLGAVAAHGGLQRQAVADVFWGDEAGEVELEAALDNSGLAYDRPEDIDDRVAGLLADGCLVGRYCGRMEWGPRALGNRSVLAATHDRAVVESLNARLQRSDFMPFAPAVLEDEADVWFVGIDRARHAAEFMTACFTATPAMCERHPTVVHVDNTARPQLVRRETNPSFHRLLTAYKRRTGSGLLLNTSFNIHEEPIVRTPEEAIRSFAQAKLDYLVLGPFLAHASTSPAQNARGVRHGEAPVPVEVG